MNETILEELFRMADEQICFFWTKLSIDDILTFIWRIAVTLSALLGIYTFYKKRKQKINLKYYRRLINADHIIVDRYQSFEKALNILSQGCNIIEINGVSGIGKTHFLQFLADMTNDYVDKSIIQKKKLSSLYGKVKKYNALYIDASNISEFQDIINNVSKIFFDIEVNDIKNEQFADLINRKLKKKLLMIILDNINNKAIHISLNNFINIYFNQRPNDLIVIGTNISLNYNHKNDVITLSQFKNREILEFYKVYNYKEPENIDEIEKRTMGLPIYIRYYLTNSNRISLQEIDKMIILRFDNCNENEKEVLSIILYMSIINNLVHYNELTKIISKSTDDYLLSLQSKFLIIQEESYFKTHDQIGKILLKELQLKKCNEQLSDKVLNTLINFHSQPITNKNTPALIFYQLLLHNKPDNTNTLLDNTFIKEYFKEQLNTERYAYILAICKCFFEQISDVEVSYYLSDINLASELHKFYILALLSIGDYCKADEEIAKYKVRYNICRIGDIKMYSEYEIYYIEADIMHLHCDYSGAINQFYFLLNVARNKCFDDYYIKTIYQIAHCERHKGKDLILAREWYDIAAKEALQRHESEYYVLGKMGVISINILIDENYDFENTLNDLLNQYLQSGKINTTLAYIHKYYGRYYLRLNNFDAAFNHYSISEKIYLTCNSRKSKYLLFDWAEFNRAKENFEKAIYYYDQCIVFGNNNNDINLVNYSLLGKLIINLDKLDGVSLINRCNDILISSKKVNNENFCLQVELIKKYYLNEIKGDIDNLIAFYKKRSLLREVSLLNKINDNNFRINEIQLNLV